MGDVGIWKETKDFGVEIPLGQNARDFEDL